MSPLNDAEQNRRRSEMIRKVWKTMIAVSVAVEKEWQIVLNHYHIPEDTCRPYPFGSFFSLELQGKNLLFYLTGARKTNASAASQYIIDHFHPEKIIAIGTCAGINPAFHIGDILLPHRAVQVDTTVKELDRLIREDFSVNIDLSQYHFPYLTGTVGSSDKAVVIWEDYLELKENGISVADTESASIAYVCRKNNVPCLIIRGISDFPQEISFEEASNPDSQQIRNYLKNVPLVMETILSQYLPEVI